VKEGAGVVPGLPDTLARLAASPEARAKPAEAETAKPA